MNTYEAPVVAGTFLQHDTKPSIDSIICHYLDGTTLKNALNFIDYIRASKMKIKWSAVNVWSVRYKGKRVLDIIVKEDSWSVRLVFDHVGSIFGLTEYDVESIRSLVGTLRVSMPRHLEPIPAMS
ncbi:MAG: hypothetical protein FWD44_08495 [Oscillospiraceae bacterium]|nr:hypothetical protein [Oscillospiraceae bacterium]